MEVHPYGPEQLAYYIGRIVEGPPIDRLPGIELKPGGRIQTVEHLGYRYIFLKPGTYTMQATYAFTDPMPEVRADKPEGEAEQPKEPAEKQPE